MYREKHPTLWLVIIILILILSQINNRLIAQISYIDSIEVELSNIKQSQERFDFLKKEFQTNLYGEISVARRLSQLITKEASQSKVDSNIATSYYFKGLLHIVGQEYDSLSISNEVALSVARKNNDSVSIFQLNKLEGLRYYYEGEFEKCVEIHLQHMGLAEQLGLSYVSTYANNIGICYEQLKEYDNALTYYNRTLEIEESENNEYNTKSIANNIAIILLNQNKAIEAEEMLRPYNDLSSGPGQNSLQLDIAASYARSLLRNGKSNLASQISNQLLAVARTHDSKRHIIIGLSNLGDHNREARKYKEALAYFQQAYDLTKSSGIKEQQQSLLANLTQTHKKLYNFEKALIYTDTLNHLKSEQRAQTSQKNLEDLNIKYQTSLKNEKIQEQEIELLNKKRSNTILLSGIVGISLFSILFFYMQRQRVRNKEKISQQESEIAQQRIIQLEKEQKINSMTVMIEGQESERRRIAKDLHDGIGGLLATVRTKMGQIQAQVDELSNLNIYLSTNEMIDQACNEVRRISHNMMPGVLHLEGLEGALEELSDQLIQVHGIKVKQDFSFQEQRLNEAQSHMIYRIVQEAFNNVIKHSGASEVLLQVIDYDDHLNLLIEDNGEGYDQSKSKEGLGLRSILSRVVFLKGTLDTSSQEGTSHSINIPLP